MEKKSLNTYQAIKKYFDELDEISAKYIDHTCQEALLEQKIDAMREELKELEFESKSPPGTVNRQDPRMIALKNKIYQAKSDLQKHKEAVKYYDEQFASFKTSEMPENVRAYFQAQSDDKHELATIECKITLFNWGVEPFLKETDEESKRHVAQMKKQIDLDNVLKKKGEIERRIRERDKEINRVANEEKQQVGGCRRYMIKY